MMAKMNARTTDLMDRHFRFHVPSGFKQRENNRHEAAS
jgi:hypothetical protein